MLEIPKNCHPIGTSIFCTRLQIASEQARLYRCNGVRKNFRKFGQAVVHELRLMNPGHSKPVAPPRAVAMRLDPHRLLHDYIPDAMRKASLAFQTMPPPSRRVRPTFPQSEEYAIVSAVAAVELFKSDPFRKQRLASLRKEERTRKHRHKHPSVRPARSKGSDDSVSLVLLREAASELNVADANRSLALMWLGFQLSLGSRNAEASFEFVCRALQHVYRRETTPAKIGDSVRKIIVRSASSTPTQEEQHYFQCSTIDALADHLFLLWRLIIANERKS